MLTFSQRANEDLTSVLSGLVAFRINDAMDPALTYEHAVSIFDDIVDHFALIPKQNFHRKNNFEGLLHYGDFVYSYRRNHTNWYAFYNKTGDDYVVTRILNNWTLVLP